MFQLQALRQLGPFCVCQLVTRPRPSAYRFRVGKRLRAVAHILAEVAGAPARPPANFVHEARRQRRSQRGRGERTVGNVLAVVRRAGEPDVAAVQLIRIADDDLPVVRAAQTMLRREVVVDLDDRLLLDLIARTLPLVRHRVRVGILRHEARRPRSSPNPIQRGVHRRIEGRRNRRPVGGRHLRREREQVHFANRGDPAGRDVVPEHAVLSGRIEDGPGACEAVRQAQLFVVEEEERLAAPVVHLRDDDRPALSEPVLIQLDVVLRKTCVLVEPVVGVE